MDTQNQVVDEAFQKVRKKNFLCSWIRFVTDFFFKKSLFLSFVNEFTKEEKAEHVAYIWHTVKAWENHFKICKYVEYTKCVNKCIEAFSENTVIDIDKNYFRCGLKAIGFKCCYQILY